MHTKQKFKLMSESNYSDLLDKVIRESLDFADELKFDKKHAYHFHLISLYGSIIELCFTVKYLNECDTKIAIPIVFRTILEADLDLNNLCKDPRYGYRLELGFIRSWLDYLGVARRGENSLLMELGKVKALPDEIKSQKAREKELEQLGYKRIDIKEKFQLAEMDNEFGAIYPKLCSHSHNGLEALRERHGKVSGNDYEMEYFKSMGTNDFEEYVLLAAEVLIRAMASINTIFKVFSSEKIDKIRNDFHENIER